MLVAIALHQRCRLGLSMSRMLLCVGHAAEKQTEHDGQTILHLGSSRESSRRGLGSSFGSKNGTDHTLRGQPKNCSPRDEIRTEVIPFKFSRKEFAASN